MTAPDGCVQVGWYCPGGHVVHNLVHHEARVAGPSLRFDDPCDFGVPAYVVSTPEGGEQHA